MIAPITPPIGAPGKPAAEVIRRSIAGAEIAGA